MLERPISEIGSGFWPTPVASDTTMRSKPYAQGGTPLSLAVQMWPTPTTQLNVQIRGVGAAAKHKRRGTTLAGAVALLEGSGCVNPTWTEWLMGWPLHWSELPSSETAKSPSALQPRGESLEGLEA